MKFISFKWPNHNIPTYNADIQNLYSYKKKFTVIYWNHGYLFECWFLICISGIDCVESASGNVDSHDVTRLHISMWNVILIVRTRKLIRNMYVERRERERRCCKSQCRSARHLQHRQVNRKRMLTTRRFVMSYPSI